MQKALDDIDYFTSHDLLENPHSYFDALREKKPVYQLKTRDLIIITGFQESAEVLRDTKNFSSILSTFGPTDPLPFEPEGEDISEQIEAHRSEFPAGDLVVSYDGASHAARRSLLNCLFTPTRLKANELYINELAENTVREVVKKGGCELINEVCTPFVTLVVADLLGMPKQDQHLFREAIDSEPSPFNIDKVISGEGNTPGKFMMEMGAHFYNYVIDRRQNPADDILTELAQATYPDGSSPDDIDLVKIIMFLFGAGQDTSAKLLGNSIRYLAENPELQETLRKDRSLIPTFIEEMLRLEGSTKLTFRLTTKTTKVGDTVIPAGKRVVIAMAAANRDPRQWENPHEFQLNRKKVMQHVGFGRGIHTCIGAPLARAEVKIILNQFLEQTSAITLAEPKAGMKYEPSYVIRGLSELKVNFQK